MSKMPEGTWMAINEQGVITKIDWDEAEFWAEAYRKGHFTQATFAARVAVSIREHILKCVAETPALTFGGKNESRN